MPYNDAIFRLRSLMLRCAKRATSVDRIACEIEDAKSGVIERYGKMFAPENLDALTAEDFKSFLLFKNNHHWDSLHRQGPQMTSDMGVLKKALGVLVDESLPLRQRLDHLRPTSGEAMVKGLGRAVITAILQVRHPEKYGVLNNTAESGMQLLGVWPDFPAKAGFGTRYEKVNSVLLDLAEQIPMDLWTLDMLWWRALQPSDQGAIGSASDGHPSTNTDKNAGSDISTEPIAGSEFALEVHLQEFLVANWAQTRFGSEWNLLEEDGEIVGSYYDTHEVGQIDLLAKHRTSNRWLVIELKRNQTSDATVGQILRYCSWVRENLANGDADAVEGVIICSEADLKLRYAVKGLQNVQCMTYKVNFTLSAAELQTKAQAPGA